MILRRLRWCWRVPPLLFLSLVGLLCAGCPSGKKCSGGDCGEKQACVNGFCQSQSACVKETDCPAGQTCDLQDNLCKQRSQRDCKSNDDCEGGRACRDGRCQRRKACITNIQCAIGQRCDPRDQLCKVGCDDNERCPKGESCYLEKCKPAVCGARAEKPTKEECYTGDAQEVSQQVKDGGGQCRKGTRYCIDGGQAWSMCYSEIKGTKEFCDLKDNDCNGKVDELPECKESCKIGTFRTCHTSPAAVRFAKPYRSVRCAPGIQHCEPDKADKTKGVWGNCHDERRASLDKRVADLCLLPDIDCDGKREPFRPDQRDCTCKKKGDKEACYVGAGEAPKTLKAPCKFGTRTCIEACQISVQDQKDCPKENVYLRWGECTGYVLPVAEEFEECNDVDDDCDGHIDNRSGTDDNTPLTRPCYPSDTKGCDANGKCVGACARGVETCKDGIWSLCKGAVTPEDKETCNGKDDNCDGNVDEGLTGCKP